MRSFAVRDRKHSEKIKGCSCCLGCAFAGDRLELVEAPHLGLPRVRRLGSSAKYLCFGMEIREAVRFRFYQRRFLPHLDLGAAETPCVGLCTVVSPPPLAGDPCCRVLYPTTGACKYSVCSI